MNPIRFFTDVDRVSTYAGARTLMLVSESSGLSDGSYADNERLIRVLDVFNVAAHGRHIDAAFLESGKGLAASNGAIVKARQTLLDDYGIVVVGDVIKS